MEAAPAFINVVLENISAPGQPFTQTGQEYKVTIYGDVAAPHLPYLQALLMNADRLSGGLDNAAPTMGPMLPLVQTAPHVYEATGTLDDFIDGDGQPATRVAAAVTAAAFFEYTISNEVSIEQQSPQVNINSIRIRNTTYPDWTTIAIGEGFEVTAEAGPGMAFTCIVFGVSINGSGNAVVATLPMTETSSGRYTCSGMVSVRPDVDGQPADILTAYVDTGIPGVHGRSSDEFLTYRGTIIESHLSNASRPDATDIAPGEKIKITATAPPWLGGINGGLLDARIVNSPLPGGPFVQTTDPLTESPPGSGQYSAEAVLLSVPEGVTSIRGYAGNIASGDPLIIVLSTETLAILAAPPTPPTTITTIDDLPAVNNEVTSGNLAPVIEGTAPANATVNIYELGPGGTIYTYDILVWDEKRKSDPATGTITIDNTAPTMAITSPLNDAFISGAQTTVQLTADDNIEVESVTVYLDATPAAVATKNGGGSWTATLELDAVSDGPHTISAIAMDTAGNPGNSSAISVLVDNTPVEVSEFSPAKGTRVSPQSVPTAVIVSATVFDNGSGVDHATLSVNGGPDLPINIQNIFGALKAMRTLTNQNYGTYNLVLKVHDRAGNITVVDDWTYTIAPPPVIHGICPISGAPGSEITIRGEYFTNNVRDVLAEIGYVFPAMNFQPAQVLSTSDSQIVIRIPENTPVSDPISYLGLARMSLTVQGQLAGTKIFHVTEEPIHQGELNYSADHDSSSITVIDSVTGKWGNEGQLPFYYISPDGQAQRQTPIPDPQNPDAFLTPYRINLSRDKTDPLCQTFNTYGEHKIRYAYPGQMPWCP